MEYLIDKQSAVIGTYANLKFFETKDSAKLLVELEEGQADKFVAQFGRPKCGESVHVAIARIEVSE